MISILARETERITVAKFRLKSDEIEDSGSVSVGLICFLTILIICGVAVFIVYRRYIQVQKQHQVSPHRLLESGRIKPKDVFIVTNVDNRHHIDIILNFGKYLKVITPVLITVDIGTKEEAFVRDEWVVYFWFVSLLEIDIGLSEPACSWVTRYFA